MLGACAVHLSPAPLLWHKLLGTLVSFLSCVRACTLWCIHVQFGCHCFSYFAGLEDRLSPGGDEGKLFGASVGTCNCDAMNLRFYVRPEDGPLFGGGTGQ